MEDFISVVKITAVKKLVWNEVVFVEDRTERDSLSKKITELFIKRGIIEKDEAVDVSKTNRLDVIHGLMADCSTTDKTLVNEVISHREGMDYWGNFSDEELVKKGFVRHSQAENKICSQMLDSLNRYFQVDFTSDKHSVLRSQPGEGLREDVRKKILEKF